MIDQKNIRNIAIIAHVDHGKTTLMDQLMRMGGVLDPAADVRRVMDATDLEKERGITILSKPTTIVWNGYQFNIIDTPGHADFGGEVERILNMVDGVLLVVDAHEHVMPQTKFVVTKALEQQLVPIVLINKMDRPGANPEAAEEACLELFIHLKATNVQLNFPTLYCSAKEGWAIRKQQDPREHMQAVFETIIDRVPSPTGNPDAPFQMLVTTIDTAPFMGRVLTGLIRHGRVQTNMTVHAMDLTGTVVERGRVAKVFQHQGLEPQFLQEASAGSIVSIAGLERATVSHTIADPTCTTPLQVQPVDPPTLMMHFGVNDSPLAGREGSKLTSRMLRERLLREMESNVSLQVTEGEVGMQVAGRGELQLGILIETLRREGFELSISCPRVVFQSGADGSRLEPIEEVQIDVEEPQTGVVIECLGKRHGHVAGMHPLGQGRVRIQLDVPTRGLIGLQSELAVKTGGTAVMCRGFKGYAPYRGTLGAARNGALVSISEGKALAYPLMNIAMRGVLFIQPGDVVYKGMIIGEHSRQNDLAVNPLKGKKLTNMRASGSDREVKLPPPRIMTLEESLAYLKEDELLEVTPTAIRLRKK